MPKLLPTFYNGVPYFGPNGAPAFGTECCPYDPECVWVELSSNTSIDGEPPEDLEPPMPEHGGQIIFKGEVRDGDTPNGAEYLTILWVIAGCFPTGQDLIDYVAVDIVEWREADPWTDQGNEGTVQCTEDAVDDLADDKLVTPNHNNPFPDVVTIHTEYSEPNVLCCPEDVSSS